MAIRFFLEFKNQVVQLPVNPEEIKIISSGNNKTEEIVKLGEINILRGRKLLSCSIESFLPTYSDAPYVLTKGKFKGPQFYIDFFNSIIKAEKPARFIISDIGINMLVSIESFEHGKEGGDPDIKFKLELKEYKNFAAKLVKIIAPIIPSTPAKVEVPAAPRPKTGFAIGDTVVANGKYWYTSYGDSPFGTFNNFTGKISHIVQDNKRKYRFHITTPEGGYRGWVSESQISHK